MLHLNCGDFFRSFGIQWVLLEMVLDLMGGWRNWVGKHSLDVWNFFFLVFDVDYIKGTKSAHFRRCGKHRELIVGNFH